jgi:hypothetical protein
LVDHYWRTIQSSIFTINLKRPANEARNGKIQIRAPLSSYKKEMPHLKDCNMVEKALRAGYFMAGSFRIVGWPHRMYTCRTTMKSITPKK